MTIATKYTELSDLGLTENDIEWLITQASMGETDYTLEYSEQGSDWRMVAHDSAAEILAEQFKCDLYCLGCFSAWFIADHLGIDTTAVEAMQAIDGFEALGQLIASSDLVGFAQKAVDADGIGHFFNLYDGSETEVYIDGKWFSVMRAN